MPEEIDGLARAIAAKAKKPYGEILGEIYDTYKELAIVTPQAAACIVSAQYKFEPFERCLRRFAPKK